MNWDEAARTEKYMMIGARREHIDSGTGARGVDMTTKAPREHTDTDIGTGTCTVTHDDDTKRFYSTTNVNTSEWDENATQSQ
jgi:hypothetical protein